MWRDETLYQIWTQSSNPRRSYCDFSVWPCDLEHCVTCCARLWGNFHQVWPSTTYTCLNYSFLCWYAMSRCDLNIWPADLESSWYIKRHRDLSLYEIWAKSQSPAELFFSIFCTRHDLDLWPLDLELFTVLRVSWVYTLYKIWAKSNNPRLSYRRFSDFSRAILRGWSELTELWGMHGRIWTKLGPDMGQSSPHCSFVLDFRHLVAFSNKGGSNLNDVLNDAKFRTFWPLWKLREGWARSLYQLLKLYIDRTSEIHLMAALCVAAEHGGLIEKGKKVYW